MKRWFPRQSMQESLSSISSDCTICFPLAFWIGSRRETFSEKKDIASSIDKKDNLRGIWKEIRDLIYLTILRKKIELRQTPNFFSTIGSYNDGGLNRSPKENKAFYQILWNLFGKIIEWVDKVLSKDNTKEELLDLPSFDCSVISLPDCFPDLYFWKH